MLVELAAGAALELLRNAQESLQPTVRAELDALVAEGAELALAVIATRGGGAELHIALRGTTGLLLPWVRLEQLPDGAMQ